MKRIIFFGAIVLGILMMAGCSSEQEIRVYSISYPFLTSDQNWNGDFADYPLDSTGYHLNVKHDTLPYSINADSTRKAIRVSGKNLGNQLFMFLKRQVTTLKPNTTYQVLFTVRLASNLPTKQSGAEATFGEKIYLKVGASPDEPMTNVVNDVYQLNLNRGNLGASGTDLISIGNLAVTASTKTYTIITRNNDSSRAIYAKTNAEGVLWLIVGTDVTATGTATFYYTQLDVLLNQVD